MPRRRPCGAVASIRDLGNTRRAVNVLYHLCLREPVNMTEFTDASELFPNYAKRLREELETMGLIDVTVVRRQGPAEILEIRLTPVGREVAKRLVEIEELLQDARPERKAATRRKP